MWQRDEMSRLCGIGVIALLLWVLPFVSGCAEKNSYNVMSEEKIITPSDSGGAADTGTGGDSAAQEETSTSGAASPGDTGTPVPYRPAVAWQPTFSLGDVKVVESETSLPRMKVGASIKAKGGKVVLRDVLKGLAELKGMNVGWASDVNQVAMVDVHINPDDDFWEALDNLLRQLDYFYEFKNNTIFVKYKDTRRFYVPVPFIKSKYSTSVGGDLLGAGEDVAGVIRGNVAIESDDDDIDLWKSIEENLSRILKLGSLAVPVAENTLTAEEEANIRDLCRKQFPSRPAQQALCVEQKKAELGLAAVKKADTSPKKKGGAAGASSDEGQREGFFYTIDKPLGIITVTAPRSLLEQVEAYVASLKKELSRQVLLEAKIIEVRLDRNFQRGVDWSHLLSGIQNNNNFNGRITFGNNNILYPTDGVKLIGQFELFPKDFEVLLNALDEYGDVKVLSNPKLSLINGQPAMITVGESVRYIDEVTSTINAGGAGGDIVTYTVNTASVLSGLGFSVLANIASDDEVILHLTPVTSELQEPIEYRTFGNGDNVAEVGLPRIKLRELTTMARLKSGQVLIVGGLISNVSGRDDNQVPLLGDIPVVGHAFKNTRKYKMKRELIILLRPQIVEL